MSTSAVSIVTVFPDASCPVASAAKARMAYKAATMNQSHGAKLLRIALTAQPADSLGDVGVGEVGAL